MKSELELYVPLHGYELIDRGVRESKFTLASLGDWERAAKDWANLGPAYTLFVNDQVEACMGIALQDPTFGTCWALIPDSKYGSIVYRKMVLQIQKEIRNRKFRRLQAFIVPDFKKGVLLMEHLGFEKEGLLRKYGPGGEDMFMYARIF